MKHPPALQIEMLPLDAVRPDPLNPRRHSPKQLRQIVASIRRFGFINPILIDDQANLVAGHGRLEACSLAGLSTIPAIRVGTLSTSERRALMIADNKLADNSSWDPTRLQEVLGSLVELEIAIDDLGFDAGELDRILGHTDSASVVDDADMIDAPDPSASIVSRIGDIFELGSHRIGCLDAREAESYHLLLGDEKAQVAFTDPPYNVPIGGNVSGLGAFTHPEFQMASGEMSPQQFIAFLGRVLGHMADFSTDGSIHYVCMDWRHVHELLDAAKPLLSLKNLCIWAKDNGGMGSLYRSQHELVCVFKNGSAPHANNVNLGRLGRNRTNLWHYPGANTLRRGRLADLRDHPTVKPISLVADALIDCSKPGDLALDPFAGSGTIMFAAERTGRRARAMEIEPRYVDTAIRRFEKRTNVVARHIATGLTFVDLAAARLNEAAA